jgi:hypothetical protein
METPILRLRKTQNKCRERPFVQEESLLGTTGQYSVRGDMKGRNIQVIDTLLIA